METITRIFEFDAAHRVMNEKVKCFNLHGHRFKVELTFSFDTKGGLGYAIDFKELKRVAGAWLDEKFDHAAIFNPLDTRLIELCREEGYRVYIMGLGNEGDINPSAENLASEIFYCISRLFEFSGEPIRLVNVRLYETPNCWVDCKSADYIATDFVLGELSTWRKNKGVMSYDIREDNAEA